MIRVLIVACVLAEQLPECVIDARLPAGAARSKTREHVCVKADCCRDFRRLEFWAAAGECRLLKARDPVGITHVSYDFVVILKIV